MSSEADLKAFQLKPDSFVLPQAPRALPLPHELPRRKSHADVKAMFPKQVEIQGYCPVTYVDGNRRLVLNLVQTTTIKSCFLRSINGLIYKLSTRGADASVV